MLEASIKKSQKLTKVSEKLASGDVSAINELYEISIADESVAFCISHFRLNRNSYKELYVELVKSGAGQYAEGHWVAASSLVYAQTLSFCLEHWHPQRGFQIDGKERRDASEIIALKLISWFEDDNCGLITL